MLAIRSTLGYLHTSQIGRCKRIIIESDCTEAIKHIKHDQSYPQAEVRINIPEINFFCVGKDVHFEYVNREANAVANWHAVQARENSSSNVWTLDH